MSKDKKMAPEEQATRGEGDQRRWIPQKMDQGEVIHKASLDGRLREKQYV